jgi:hypothetical protein
LLNGSTWSTDVETSRAGFIVSVTMLDMRSFSGVEGDRSRFDAP